MNKKETIWNLEFVSICLVNFIYQLGNMMMNTLVPKYANFLGSSATMVGIVSSSFAIAALAIRPFASPAFNSFSKKRLLIMLLGVMTIVYIVYGFSKSVNLLLVMRLFHGFCLGTFAPLALSMASNAIPDSKMASGVGIYSLGQAVGQAIGPSTGLAISEKLGYNYAFFIGAGIIFIAFIMCFFIKDMDNIREPYRIAFDKIIAKDAIHPSVLMFLTMIPYTCISSYIAIYGAKLNISNIGMYFTVYAGSLLLIRPICGKLMDKFGYMTVMIPGIVFFSVTFAVLSFARSLPMILVAAVISAFGFGICQPTIQTLAISSVQKEKRGIGANTNFFFTDCGAFVGPIVGGKIIDTITNNTGSEITAYSQMYLYAIIPLVIALVYLFATNKVINKNIDKNRVKSNS